MTLVQPSSMIDLLSEKLLQEALRSPNLTTRNCHHADI